MIYKNLTKAGITMDKETKDRFLRELMEATYERIYTFIDRRQADKDFAEDVVQETFLEAYRKAEVLMDHPNQLGWLYITARNKMLKLNSRKRDFCFFEDGEAIYLENLRKEDEQYGEIELEEAIKATVGEEEYHMLHDYYLGGYSSEEMAEKYGLESGNVRMRVSRLKKKLRKNL